MAVAVPSLEEGAVVPSPILLAVTALVSAFLGQVSDAVIIGVILAAGRHRVLQRVQSGEDRRGTPLAELRSCALMGTVVRAGSGIGVVVATGGDAEFGRIAVGLGQQQPETEFQAWLRKFSMLLVQVASARPVEGNGVNASAG